MKEKQTVMFGASWCPHCAAQKKLFGKSIKSVPYFECAV
jgi:glutaredoxin